MKLRTFAVVAIFLALAAWVYFQRQTIALLRAENAALQYQPGELDQLRAENQRLAAGQFDKDEFEKLKSEHSELLRLRGEIGRLKRQQGQTLSKTSASAASENQAPTLALTTNDFVQFATNFTAQLQNGETMITGGWESEGRKTFVFVTPQFTDAAGNAVPTAAPDSQIVLTARFLEIANAKISGEIADKLVSGRLGDSQLDDFLKVLKNTDGVSFTGTPRVLTLNGRQAQVASVETIDVQGTKIEVGPSIDFLPQISADGSSVSVEVQAVVVQRKQGGAGQ